MPAMEASVGVAVVARNVVGPWATVACDPYILYVAPTPPANPRIRIAEARAGENRTCRSQFAGSNGQPAQEAALLGRLQRFLQPHARGRQQIRRRIGRHGPADSSA